MSLSCKSSASAALDTVGRANTDCRKGAWTGQEKPGRSPEKDELLLGETCEDIGGREGNMERKCTMEYSRDKPGMPLLVRDRGGSGGEDAGICPLCLPAASGKGEPQPHSAMLQHCSARTWQHLRTQNPLLEHWSLMRSQAQKSSRDTGCLTHQLLLMPGEWRISLPLAPGTSKWFPTKNLWFLQLSQNAAGSSGAAAKDAWGPDPNRCSSSPYRALRHLCELLACLVAVFLRLSCGGADLAEDVAGPYLAICDALSFNSSLFAFSRVR